MRSLRFRLIFWNTAILALALVAVCGTIAFLNLRRMAESIDRELADRARNFGRAPGGGGFGGPFQPMGPGGPAQRQPQQEGGQGGSGQIQEARPPATNIQFQGQGQGQGPGLGRGQGPGQPGAGQGPPPFRDPEAERIGSIRRPRLIDAEGKSVGSMGTDAIFDPKAIEKARAGETYYSEAVFQGEQVRVLTAPAERFGVGFVGQFARELRDYNALARVQWLTLLTVLPFALILAALGGRFLTGRAMRPIADMGEAAARIGGGDFDRRIPVAGDDEFATLGVRFNEMATSLGVSFANQRAAYERLEQAYEQQRRFVGDASHELRTPLTRLQLATSEALADPSSDSKKALAVADESARAMAKLVKQLLDLAKADAGELKPVRQEVDLRALVADVVHDLPEGQPEVTLDLPDQAVSVSVDPDQIARVILNLVDNARRYTSADGTITVRVRDGMFEVRDTGEGIAPEHLPHVRERFYRADAARSREAGGAGLGLAIIDEIVAAHSGSLEIESQPGVGTVVRVNV